MDISVVLPTYNERRNIGNLVAAIEAVLPPTSLQIIVIDDNSPDGTAEVVRELALRKGSPVELHVRTGERGLATAIKFGLERCRGRIVVVMDTDFNHDPRMIPQMVDLLKYYDLVIGSRFVMGGGMENRLRYYLSFLFNLFVRVLIHTQIQDNLSGFFAFQREKLMKLDLVRIFRGYGEYFIRLLHAARQHGYVVIEVPVFYILRRHGQSKSRFLSMLRDYTRCALEIRFGQR